MQTIAAARPPRRTLAMAGRRRTAASDDAAFHPSSGRRVSSSGLLLALAAACCGCARVAEATDRPIWAILSQPNRVTSTGNQPAFSAFPADWAFVNAGRYMESVHVQG